MMPARKKRMRTSNNRRRSEEGVGSLFWPKVLSIDNDGGPEKTPDPVPRINSATTALTIGYSLIGSKLLCVELSMIRKHSRTPVRKSKVAPPAAVEPDLDE